jgi:hypothetical protein
MNERDWRIFREDFNIAYKGHNTVLPIRNWDEAKFPKEIRKVGAGVCGCVCVRACSRCMPAHARRASTAGRPAVMPLHGENLILSEPRRCRPRARHWPLRAAQRAVC